MRYFEHDSAASQDEKLTLLFIEHGYEGLGLYYAILERLAAQEKPINTVALKAQLKVGKKLEKCWKFMESLEIISSTNGETFSKRLSNFIESYRKNKKKDANRKRQKTENQQSAKNFQSESEKNPHLEEKRIEENRIKEKEEKEIPPTPPVSQIPANYPVDLSILKSQALKNEAFRADCARKFVTKGDDPERLAKWLDNFNEFLRTTGEEQKTQKDYNLHFIRWVQKIPNYTTMEPESYLQAKKPQQQVQTGSYLKRL